MKNKSNRAEILYQYQLSCNKPKLGFYKDIISRPCLLHFVFQIVRWLSVYKTLCLQLTVFHVVKLLKAIMIEPSVVKLIYKVINS